MSREFHTLRVAGVAPLTGDAAVITFDIPAELAENYRFAPGQWLTVQRDGERRSYSICSRAGEPPRIGVREVPGGAVSSWLVRSLAAGDRVDVQVPSGSFTPDLRAPGTHVLIAAGSGITPMISIAASVLAAHADSAVTLLYGNRRSDTVMFADEIADLKDSHPARLQVLHVLSREAREVEIGNGRLDAARLRELVPALVQVDAVDHWWLCGPLGMVTDAIDVLTDWGVPRERVHRELFWVEESPPEPVTHTEAPAAAGATVTLTLDGRSSTLTVPAGATVLEAGQRVRPDLPFACKGGVCGTCRARLIDGEVRMRRNYALEPDEVAAGYVLTCQSEPVSDEVALDFDA